MRLAAFVVTLALLGAAGLAGQDLWQTLQAPVPPRAAALAATAPEATPGPQADSPPQQTWPALFGTLVVPEPQPPKPPEPAAEPQPPSPPAPPLASLGFALKGVVSDGANRWAMVSHPTGEQLLRVGDPLGEVYTVTRIDVQGLWAQSAPEAEAQLLGFGE